jgi:hypothetical protein
VFQDRIQHGLVIIESGDLKVIFGVGCADEVEHRGASDALSRGGELGDVVEQPLELLHQSSCEGDVDELVVMTGCFDVAEVSAGAL